MNKSTPLNQLPFGAQQQQQQQQPPQPMLMQPQQQQQQQQQQPPMLPQYAMTSPMPTNPQQQQGLAPPSFTLPQSTQPHADILDDDMAVNDALKQITGSLGTPPQMLPSSMMPPAGPPQLQQQQQPIYDTMLPELVGGDMSGTVDIGQPWAAQQLQQQQQQQQQVRGFNPMTLTWAELGRMALIVVTVYLAVECLPVGHLLSQHLPALANAPYAILLIKAILIGTAYMAAQKFL
jgi:hypothetical protein